MNANVRCNAGHFPSAPHATGWSHQYEGSFFAPSNWALSAVVLFSMFVVGTAYGQDEPSGALPNQPIVEGRQVFEKKGCVHCHSVWGSKAMKDIGPNLAGKAISWRNLMSFSGALWNHMPTMNEQFRAQQVERSTFTPDEMEKLASYLLFVKLLGKPGDVARGRDLFQERLCARCHQLRGVGGTVGPRLDELKDYVSPFFLALTLWNHGPKMAEKLAELNLPRPVFQSSDVADIVAFIRGESRIPAVMEMAYAQAGIPGRGERVFRDKGCVECHAIAGSGGTVGPALDQGKQNLDISELAGTFWNHGAEMWAKMKERGMGIPRLSEREMADLLSYLAYVQFVDTRGDAEKGEKLFKNKSCSSCHAVGGKGPSVGPDLGRSNALRSGSHWTAAIWNHAPAMEKKLQETEQAWPRFQDDEMRDMVEFLRSSHESK